MQIYETRSQIYAHGTLDAMSAHDKKQDAWQVWVETGGTFTDCVAVDPNGNFHRAKVLSSSTLRGSFVEKIDDHRWRVSEQWNAPLDFIRGQGLWLISDTTTDAASPVASITAYDPDTQTIELDRGIVIPKQGTFEIRFSYEAPVLAARLVTRTLPAMPLPPMDLRVATTRGTNALLTRGGTPPAFFVTAGFGDLLEIGTQQRPDLFALDIVKPQPLTSSVVEVEERLAADGSVVRKLDTDSIRQAAEELVASGIRTAAVALAHSYRNPHHEQQIAAILRDAGFRHISLSSELAPFIKLLPRAQTAVVNAYLAPILKAYMDGIACELSNTHGSTNLHVMTSAGGLVRSADFRPKDSLLSGPAGGVAGALHMSRLLGYDRVISFDMGGTSTDVSRCEGDFDYIWEHKVGDAQMVAPALAIETVAAGGGSICWVDRNGGLQVGPQSAGASPGAACYGAGGPLTITDANLLMGRVAAERFNIPLDVAAAEQAADALLEELAQYHEELPDREGVLQGLLDIANERMADAIRRISVRRGYDPSEYALVAFGGAGGQHACAVASRLGIRTIIIPPDASLFSAWGLGQAVIEGFAERQILSPLNDLWMETLPGILSDLEQRARNSVLSEGVRSQSLFVRRRLITIRLSGQEAGLEIEYVPGQSLSTIFAARYRAVYGYHPAPERQIEIEAIRIVVGTVAPTLPMASGVPDTSTLYIEAGWAAAIHQSGATILTTERTRDWSVSSAEAVRETLFAGRFVAIAQEMGEALRQTALSTNVKERLDFSCALLDSEGRLVANAAHIPVHLGALGECVRRVREAIPLGLGDVAITNHPAWGGSHLPDVTVITPVFDKTGLTLLGYVANRAHHSEIGGTRPGSMPPNATTLAEEGVVIAPAYLMQKGQSCLDIICGQLSHSLYPTRALNDNRADLEAALAANRQGERLLVQLAEQHGAAMVRRYMNQLQIHAETMLRARLRTLSGREYAATEFLDDGTPISVRVTITDDVATIDFTGSGPVHPGNLNATPAIVTSAVLYVLRLLVAEELPLNEGLLLPVTLILPPYSIVNPSFDRDDPTQCPAVVGGNTETSQRIVDTLLKAFGLAACSQGTMNNTLWGSDTFGYYETVCGGAGATANAPGASAVHTHMTNTRVTDIEVVELRYPVRIERFAIRRGSGGAGANHGGNGVIRETTFLRALSLSLVTQHRNQGSYGMEGGAPGVPGRQRIIRAGGKSFDLAAISGCNVEFGDRLLLETPGGGAWGAIAESTPKQQSCK